MATTDSGLHVPSHTVAEKKQAPTVEGEVQFPFAERITTITNAYLRPHAFKKDDPLDDGTGWLIMTLMGHDVSELTVGEQPIKMAFTAVMAFNDSLQLARSIRRNANLIPLERRK